MSYNYNLGNLLEIKLEVKLPGAVWLTEVAIWVAEGQTELNKLKIVYILSHSVKLYKIKKFINKYNSMED